MAVYGLSIYGQDLYGLSGFGARAGQGFSAANVRAEPIGDQDEGRYGQVSLTWEPPLGEWTNLRVVRQFAGFPTSIFDGSAVHESLKEENVRRVLDSPLTEGVAVYYSLFVQAESNDVWFLAGSAWTMVVEDHGFHELLQDALPDAAMRADYESSAILPEERKYPLLRFLEVPAFELDRYKTYIETLEHLYNPDVTPAAAVPLLTEQFGINPEPSIGVSRIRTLARNASYLNTKRGTLPGVEALASAFTGWGATVTVGVNLMLRDDEVNWSADGTASIVGQDATPTTDAQFGLVMGDTAAVRIRSADVAGRERFYAIPVSAATQYAYSFEVQPETTTEDFTPVLRYYDADGSFLSETAGTPVTAASGSWTQVTEAFTTPADTRFAEPVIDVTGGAVDDEHYFKDIQLEEGSSFTSYEPPRQAIITFAAPYTNFITTPSFEDAIAPAFAVTNATTAFDATFARSGTDSWEVTPTTLGTDTVVESSDSMPVQPGSPAMFRISVRPVTTDVSVLAEVVWLDDVDAEVSSASNAFNLTADEWNDLFLVEQAPGGAAKAKVRLTWQDVVVNLDAVALIDSYGVEYFDGDSLTGETLWEGGNDHNAESYYYPLRQIRQARFNKVLPNFLPLNRQWTLRYADSV